MQERRIRKEQLMFFSFIFGWLNAKYIHTNIHIYIYIYHFTWVVVIVLSNQFLQCFCVLKSNYETLLTEHFFFLPLLGMGTKLQFVINPLVASSNNSFLLNQLSDCGYPPKIGSSKHSKNCSLSYFNHSLDEEMFDLDNIESIKNTMLIQDDIFKLQASKKISSFVFCLTYIIHTHIQIPQFALQFAGKRAAPAVWTANEADVWAQKWQCQ